MSVLTAPSSASPDQFRRGEVTCRVRLGHPWRGLVRGRRRTAV